VPLPQAWRTFLDTTGRRLTRGQEHVCRVVAWVDFLLPLRRTALPDRGAVTARRRQRMHTEDPIRRSDRDLTHQPGRRFRQSQGGADAGLGHASRLCPGTAAQLDRNVVWQGVCDFLKRLLAPFRSQASPPPAIDPHEMGKRSLWADCTDCGAFSRFLLPRATTSSRRESNRARKRVGLCSARRAQTDRVASRRSTHRSARPWRVRGRHPSLGV
jgi:hypothetical protein